MGGSSSGTGGGTSGGLSVPAGGLSARLRSFDLYRKIPRDLTEASAVGGSVSIAFALFFLLILYLELSNFLAVRESTAIEIDHSEDSIFQMNINLTFESLSCEYLGVDVENVLGRRRVDILDHSLHKYSLDGVKVGSVSKGGAGDNVEAEWEHLYDGTDKDVYGVKRYAIELTPENFVKTVDEFEVLLVDFHAPWCPHCQRLAPIYEHAAHLVREQAPHEVDGHHKHSIALASFDCTVKAHQKICMDNGIQAFPTILVFRQSKVNRVTGPRGRYNEQYTGARKAEPLAKFAISVLKEVQAEDKGALPEPHKGHDVEKDGKPESKVTALGCRVEGFLNLRRVPGRVIFHPKLSGHTFETGLLKLDHFIRHLSFGKHSAKLVRSQTLPVEGAYADKVGRPIVLAEGIDEIPFSASDNNYTHEHYIKVIGTSRRPHRGKSINAYEYTISSDTHPTLAEVPQVIFSYDLAPFKVVVVEETKPWIEGFTSMCAILGGVYTVSVLFEGVLSSVVNTLTKKLD
ncbi:Protein disulfide-isomerase 5-4 [Hondaea fermentalgiana]|uniref:Protein disulfide-isomerase 5-4 n=1 Tax=Hondaea fermentalgiana TaxID=2315210 RepID=A0A2R5GKX7_9STRA|nr:Protein disulfide-isomerase 5-4 [Hondaea fermentalgiana]|eukprot:GBG29273.1 Protein disulfide-isomerase 5-4 [Hondaea fermentalgiana]